MDTFSNTQNPESAPQNSLERFLKAQESSYPQALEEIRNGRKQTHWIWYIFPQLRGLGHSYNANFYGIADLEEARRYLNHPFWEPVCVKSHAPCSFCPKDCRPKVFSEALMP